MTNEDLRRELEKLTRPDGRLSPRDVARAARPEDHPLHPYFEWDDREAAESHRVQQARELIHRVRVSVVVEEVTYTGPAYVRDPEPVDVNVSGYRDLATIAEDGEASRRALARAVDLAAGYLRREAYIAARLGWADALAREQRRLARLANKIRGPSGEGS